MEFITAVWNLVTNPFVMFFIAARLAIGYLGKKLA